jgi:hypothetical protein
LLNSRALLTVLLALALGFLGLATGTTLAGAWLVPEGSGLAGPAVALAYGLLGAVAALTAGVIAGIKASLRTLRAATTAAAVGSVIVFALLTWSFLTARADRIAARDQAHEALTPFQRPYEMTLRIFAAAGGGLDFPFSEMRIEQTESTRTAVWETLGPDPDRCRAPAPPLATIDVAAALQQVDATLRSAFPACTNGDEEPTLARVEWNIPALASEEPRGALRITAGCLNADDRTRLLIDSVAALYRQVESSANCSSLDRGIAAAGSGGDYSAASLLKP